MLRHRTATFCSVLALIFSTSLTSAATSPATVPVAADPVAAGRVLLGELNCTACHPASPAQAAWLSPKVAPRLNEIGSRVSPQWIAGYLAEPHKVTPGVTMPDMLAGLPVADRPAAAEALAHYLLSKSPPKAKQVLPDRAAVARGQVLYHTIGCVACHPPQDRTAPPTQEALPLTDLQDKWRYDGLRRFLRDPLAFHPSGRMPAMNLSDAEASDIAHYLLRKTRTPATLEVAVLRGPIRSPDDIDAAEPSGTGAAAGLSLEGIGQDRGAAVRFTGWLLVDQAGDYTFFLTSAGFSRLAIDGKWLAGEESWQRERVDGRAKVRLGRGAHAIMVDFSQRRQKEPSLRVEWEGPGIARQAIPPSRLRSTQEAAPEPTVFVLDAAKAERGRALYTELNCAACHDHQPPAAALPSLALVDTSRGCLAEEVSGRSADYQLVESQRQSLRAALTELRRPDLTAPSHQQQLQHTLATFRCTACHSRDGAGGVTADRDAYFTSAGEDLGDEGRLPPRLDGVGNKLRPEAIAAALQGAAVRPYLNTRMPRFGDANTAHVPQLLASIDRQPVTLKPSADPPDIQRDVGRQLVGTGGLSCIACHRFNRQPALTMQVVDLITAPDRLNEDWFRQFLIDPNRFHPGTRMPSFWPEGKSLLPKLLDGDTARQQAAIWTYLSDKGQAKFPEGLGRQNVELIVGGEAVVYRGKLWEAGFRAIAVGYPGQVNAAFDAEQVRLSLLWRGRFLNAGPHWTVQGMGRIRPLGTDVIVFPQGSALAVLPDAAAPWPADSPRVPRAKFGGYQLDSNNRPTLIYSFDGKRIEDVSMPLEGEGPGLHRTLTFVDPPVQKLYLRLAVGKLRGAGERAWRLNDALTISVKGGTPTVRGGGDQQELIVAVPVGERSPRLEVEYAW